MIFYTVFDVNSVLKQITILAPYLFYVDTLIRSNDLIFVQKLGDSDVRFSKKMQKPLFLGILGKNGPNWAQKGPFSNFW